jgi:hypothetical protein
MYERLTRVHDNSCDMPGMMSNRILPRKMRTMWIAHAPGLVSRVAAIGDCRVPMARWTYPLATVQCSAVQGRSWLTLCVDPFGVQVGQGRLVAELLQRLGRLLVDKTTATSPASLLCVQGHVAGRGGAGSVGPRVASETQAGGTVEEYG